MDINKLQRENIRNLRPYSTARDEYKGQASIFLDANENSYGSPRSPRSPETALTKDYNRYPDPLQLDLKEAISKIKGVPIENTFLGNGSDEAIDLLFRAFCEPGQDNVVILPPTYGMYEVSAGINNVAIRKVNLLPSFQLDLDGIAEAIDEHTKLIFICSPNNPTGNSIVRTDIETVLANFNGLVVIDEAYINYAKQRTFIKELTEYPNLVVLQTFSKAWGLAALRLGMAFASRPVIDVLNKVKPPYNINQATQDIALDALKNIEQVNEWIKVTVAERESLGNALAALPMVKKVYPSDANFILIEVDDALNTYNSLVEHGIIIRDRSKVTLCEGCLRITIGTVEENKILLETLKTL
ncbi:MULTISPECIES: histidinol-phosphate transaminase [Pedobacter]|uniref:Histidinol-phosphate aminotransferase n=1 Tax=Pedobacter heparinus (strain ATCC 13125 / DSM 2366 / CIP 104194 / JCM 7457 / NBRC 12017 / NCIMB 9290 / NRRL B-14731 / HIM 762-3) TaxID=485917 RepID=C6Y3G3_PEDHD|nr:MULTISPECIES: histidinol-phosphate transaminase [Pedobacter]ACU05388.1 histidinol-phosphate aminotransferase [Pedobacter heparinus DSM 2366]MBB5439461.1 histidinol-phosphate aminotransferase [Pedobacter sp. AK017]